MSKKKYKIAIVIERADSALGGAEKSLFDLSHSLSANDHDVHILAAKGQTQAKNIHVLCRELHGKRVPLRTFSAAVCDHLSENDYDIVHSFLPIESADLYQPRGGTYAEAIRRNTASYQSKILQSYKTFTSVFNFKRHALLQAEKQICTDPNGPVTAALSEYVAAQFRKHYKMPEERIAVVPNGVRTGKVADKEAAEHLLSQIMFKLRIKEADRPIFFLFAANNFRLKGLNPLMHALRMAIDKYDNNRAILVVAGSGSPYPYRLLAHKLRLGKRIIFTGRVRQIQTALHFCDVAVLPTFYDPCSRFILEALAANKPVITTRQNGAAERYINYTHGRIVGDARNVPAIADAIAYYSNTDHIEQASQQIQKDNLAEEVSVTKAAEKLVHLYETIIKNRRDS